VRVLTVNTGSSSVKLRVLDADDTPLATVDTVPDDVGPAVTALLGDQPVDAVGHRVVHGGPHHVDPEVVDDPLLADLRELVPLSRLHQPVAVAAIEAVRAVRPDLPAVACFDTAFHAGLPESARTYALPQAWRDRFGLRRYGFHGLSYAGASRRAAELLERDDARLVVAHLGSGASLAAIHGSEPVDTTMGWTPLEGIVMATRSGSVDPGLLLWLVGQGHLSADEVLDGIDREGGLLALAGTKDMREVLELVAAGDPPAVLALEVYLHRLVAGLAAMTAALGGIDALVFTGGIGERSAELRRRAVAGLAFLGIDVDGGANERLGHLDGGGTEITGAGSRARVLVIAAREDVEIAHGARAALGGGRG
jgi:acetate kinase